MSQEWAVTRREWRNEAGWTVQLSTMKFGSAVYVGREVLRVAFHYDQSTHDDHAARALRAATALAELGQMQEVAA